MYISKIQTSWGKSENPKTCECIYKNERCKTDYIHMQKKESHDTRLIVHNGHSKHGKTNSRDGKMSILHEILREQIAF